MLWHSFQGALGLWAVEFRCRNSSHVWRQIELLWLWALYQAVNEKYAYCKRQLRKLLHFGEPPEEVLKKARASTVKALSMLSRFPTAAQAAAEAHRQATFAQFHECVPSVHAFPVRDWDMDYNYPLTWSRVYQGSEGWWTTTADQPPNEADLLASASAMYRASEQGCNPRLEPGPHHWHGDLQWIAPASGGSPAATETTLAMLGHGPLH